MLYVLLIIAMGAFRDTTIGTDINKIGGGGYYGLWSNPFNSLDSVDVEPGFLYLSYILKTLYNSYYFYYGSIFTLTMLFYYWAARNMRINQAVFFAIFFMSTTINTSFNIIRQILALAAAVLAYSYLLYDEESYPRIKPRIVSSNIMRLLIYEIIIIFLYINFHTSVIILTILPIFNLKYIKSILSKDVILWGLLIAVLLINYFFGQYIQQFILLAQSVLHIGGRADVWANYLESFSDKIDSTHGLATIAISGSIAILASRERRNILFYIGFTGFLLSSLASANLGVVARVFGNLSIFLIFYYAQIFGELLTSYKLFKFDFRWVIVLLFLFDWVTGFYFTTILNEEISPYKTYIF